MNPVKSYFRSHDTKYLAHAENPGKLQGTIRILRVVRVVLFLLSAPLWAMLVAGIAIMVVADDFRDIFPEVAIPGVGVIFALILLFDAWVTEALLFRQYIQKHQL
jgi:hypothetical protein